ncbi:MULTISPECIES: hypothetical protein [unclassified Mannheimia]|uniref:hypothetical protein n=1 Tax=unclassified Mannheimia TaxID=2645054 RepID=UPI00359EEAEC
MKKAIQFMASLMAIFALCACSQTTTNPSIGKSDFIKYQQWIEAEPLKDEPDMQEPETPEKIEKFLDKNFDRYIQQGKALAISHKEVKELRDRTVKHIDTYMREYMKLYVLSFGCNGANAYCKSLEPRANAFKQKAQNMEAEISSMEKEYERLAKQFGVEAGSILR